MNNHFISIDSAELNKFFRQMDNYTSKTKSKVRYAIAKSANAIQKDAKENLTASGTVVNNVLRGTIEAQIMPGGYTGTVKAPAKYAAYVEFGTGRLVRVPAGYEAYAGQFKGQGKRKVNLKARPYLIPAVEKHRPLFIENLKKAFNEATI